MKRLLAGLGQEKKKGGVEDRRGEERRVEEDMWLGRHPPPFLGK